MSYSISITKRTNGGYTVVADSNTSYPSEAIYHGTSDGVILFSRGLNLLRFYRPEDGHRRGTKDSPPSVQV